MTALGPAAFGGPPINGNRRPDLDPEQLDGWIRSGTGADAAEVSSP